jgi:hypothetical protein
VSKDPTCDAFRDALDALAAGELAPAERERLLGHAQACPDCGTLWRLHRHLAATSAAELEAAVPARLVDGLWRDVAARLPDGRAGAAVWTSRRGPAWRGRSWLAPALAAALVVLTFAAGSLYGELRASERQRRQLADRLLRQEAILAASGPLLRAPSRSHGRGFASRLTAAGGSRLPHTMTAAELGEWLGSLPPETVVLAPDRLAAAREGWPVWRGLSRRLGAADVDVDDGLAAAEVIRIIETLNLDPDASISRTALRDLLPTGAFPARGRDAAANREVDHEDQ